MPRNASGNYTLPLPSVVTGTVIESLWANTTMNDLAASVTDSLDRYGRGGMVAPFRMVDGTVSTPAISFSSETNTGLYKPSAGVVSLAVLGAEVQTWTSAATTLGIDLNVLGDFNVLGQFEIDGDIVLADNRSLAWGDISTRLNGNGTTDVITAWTAGLERLRISDIGAVGINTNTPVTRLHVKGDGPIFRIESTTPRGSGSSYMELYDPTGRKGWIGYGGATDTLYVTNELAGVVFSTNALERMFILPTGQVGIGSNAIVGQLDVQASGAGIISKSAIENGTVAHLGVYNLNVNGLQWYLAQNANNIDIHNPRGNQDYWISGVKRFTITPSFCAAIPAMLAQNSGHQVGMWAQAAPYLQLFYSGIIEWRMVATAAAQFSINQSGTIDRLLIDSNGMVYPGGDNTQSLGLSSKRWSVVYAATGSINTSDARDKTDVAALTDAEVAAARDLAREIGTFRLLDALAEKGHAARWHIGMAVQRAIKVLESHGLDPLHYAFICHDEWPDADGVPQDRYGFRVDQLLLFITRGQEARLAALEA